MFDEIVNSILSGIQSFIGDLVNRLMDAMSYVAEQIKSAIQVPFSNILTTLSGMVSWFSTEIMDSIQSGFSYISQAFASALEGIAREIADRFTAIQSMFGAVKKMVAESAVHIYERIADMGDTLGERIREGFTSFGEKMEKMASIFRDAIGGAVDAVSRAGDAIINALTNVAVLLKTFLERIVEVLTNILQYM
ncbi:hypothetical protein, partial [Metallosphaera sp.]|uniref:hypothetical protein n=1 Tax=Metallosphaera sp. TaxID=2020860 RepID=UPI00317C9DAC